MSQKSLFESDLLNEDDSDDDDLLSETKPSPFADAESRPKPPPCGESNAAKQESDADPEAPLPVSDSAIQERGMERRSRKIVYEGLSHARFNAESPSMLHWHCFKHNKKDAVFYPCRVKRHDEGMPTTGKPLDETKEAMVELLAHHAKINQKNIAIVQRTQLRPYYGEKYVADDGDCLPPWCPKLSERYEKKVLAPKLLSRKGIIIERFFLQRVLEEARRKEQQAQQQGQEDDIHPTVLFDESMFEDSAPAKPSASCTDASSDDDSDEDEIITKEKLRAGDRIEYTPVMYTAGTGRSKEADIVSVDRNRFPMLVLRSDDFLPPGHPVKLVARKIRNKLVQYSGQRMAIEEHSLVKSAVNGDYSVSAGTAIVGARIGGILDRKLQNVQQDAIENGMGPTDIFHKFKTNAQQERAALGTLVEKQSSAIAEQKSLVRKRRAKPDDSKEPERSKKRRKTSSISGTTLAANVAMSRSRSRQAHISESNQELAVTWKTKIVDRYGHSEKQFKNAVAAMAEKVGTTEDQLAKFLDADPLRLVAAYRHEETANSLRDHSELLDTL